MKSLRGAFEQLERRTLLSVFTYMLTDDWGGEWADADKTGAGVEWSGGW